MKIIQTLLISLLAGSISAQVGIGTSTPTVPLDIEATNAAIDINNTSTNPLIHFQVSGTTNFTIGTDVADSKFKIGTTALETGTAITVQPTGEVGIGTTSPSHDLHLVNSLHGNMKIQGYGLNYSAYLDLQNTSRSSALAQTGGYYRIQSDGGATYNGYLRFIKMSIDGTSVISEPLRMDESYVRTLNCIPQLDNTYDLGHASFRWDDVYATNGTIQTSDRRLKTNIKTLEYGLAEVMQLTPVSFNWKSDSAQTRNKIGYIAQEVQKVIPEVVNVGDDENQTLGMNYAEMVVVLTNAIKEQQAIIEAQKKENASQNEEIENLKQETSSAINSSTDNAKKFAALEAKLNALLLNQNVTLSAKK